MFRFFFSHFPARSPLQWTVVLLSIASLAACASRPEDVMSPVAQTAPGASRIDMVVATTRRVATSPGDMTFSGERSATLNYANIVVSIPPDTVRKKGEVQWPTAARGNPETDFVVTKTEGFDFTQMRNWVHRMAAAAPKHRVLVFVHGFNNKFSDAVFRFAQIVHDSGAEVVPLLFTWPSRGSLWAYGYDRESTTVSRDGLEHVLTMLAHDPKVGEVTILSHSMGNMLTLETLRQMAIRNRRLPPKIANVMLAAPDVDIDVFRSEISDIPDPRPNFTLLLSRDDHALAVSRRVWGDLARLGAIDPEEEPYRSELAALKVTTIDLTHHETDDPLNHGKFASSPELVRLIGGRLETDKIGDSGREGLGERIMATTTGAATSVGTAAGLAITAPIAIVDPATRHQYSEDLGALETQVQETVSSAVDGQPSR